MAITLYHGSRRWNGPPQVQRGRDGRTEHGPGIYLTTSYERARRYGKPRKVILDEDLAMLEGAEAPIAEILAYAKTMRAKTRMLEDLQRSAQRLGPRERMPVSYLVNLAVNNDALTGAESQKLAAWLVSKGIDASLVEMSGSPEDWLVVFNPEKILRVEEALGTHDDAPLLRPAGRR